MLSFCVHVCVSTMWGVSCMHTSALFAPFPYDALGQIYWGLRTNINMFDPMKSVTSKNCWPTKIILLKRFLTHENCLPPKKNSLPKTNDLQKCLPTKFAYPNIIWTPIIKGYTIVNDPQIFWAEQIWTPKMLLTIKNYLPWKLNESQK